MYTSNPNKNVNNFFNIYNNSHSSKVIKQFFKLELKNTLVFLALFKQIIRITIAIIIKISDYIL